MAVQALVVLAETDGPCSSSAMAQDRKAHAVYLRRVLAQLVRANLILAREFWNRDHGLEFPLQLLASSLAIGLVGPGNYSLDALFGIALPQTLLFGVLAAAALLVDVIGLINSRSPLAAQTEVGSQAS